MHSNTSDHETPPKRLVGLLESAQSLGVSDRYLRQLHARGELRIIRIGRRIMVPVEELNRLATEGTGGVR